MHKLFTNVSLGIEIRAFVFFSFSPHLSFIKFIHQIKKANKKIVFLQDNHQFSIHQGTVNSMIFEPDLSCQLP